MKRKRKEMMENENYRTVIYGLIEEKYSLGAEVRRAYGIASYANATDSGTAEMLASVHDVTSERPRIEELISTCNRLELSPIHLSDVIDDFLM